MRHLFVVAHPDDEVLGAGAMIRKAVSEGHTVGVVIMNTCDETRYDDDRSKILRDMEESHRILGISESYLYTHEDGNFHLADHRGMVQEIEQSIRLFSPDCIYTHNPSDNNQDHIVVAQACMEAFRIGQRGRDDMEPVRALYTMEVLSSTDWGINPAAPQFTPNTFVPVDKSCINAKVRALYCYENVIRDAPHPRSVENIEALARYRGCQSGFEYAEAFQCIFRRYL